MAEDETTVATAPTGQTLELHSRRWDHPGRTLNQCPRCDVDLMRVALTELAYVFDTCNCGVSTYTHLVEQMWHRTCHAAESGDRAVTALEQSARYILDAQRSALALAHKAILAEANAGKASIPARQQVTYPGGLRRAARIVDGLLGRVLEQSKKDGQS